MNRKKRISVTPSSLRIFVSCFRISLINYEKLRQYADLFSERVLKASQYLDSKFPNQTIYDFRNYGNRLPVESKFCDKCGSRVDY